MAYIDVSVVWDFFKDKGLNDFAASGLVGNLELSDDVELEYLWEDLQKHKTVMKALKDAKSVTVASNTVLTGYIKPADKVSVKVKKQHAAICQKIYDRYHTDPVEPVVYVCVKVGAFKVLQNAERVQKAVQDLGLDAFIAQHGKLYSVQVRCPDAQDTIAKLKAHGLNAILIE